MKKFMFTNCILLSVIILSSFTSNYNISTSNDIIGAWDYSVPNAPYEYQKGQLILEENAGELSGYTMVNDFKNEIDNPKLEGSNLTFSMYIEGTDVSFNLNFKENNFSGKVTYTEGILEITGIKKE